MRSVRLQRVLVIRNSQADGSARTSGPSGQDGTSERFEQWLIRESLASAPRPIGNQLAGGVSAGRQLRLSSRVRRSRPRNRTGFGRRRWQERRHAMLFGAMCASSSPHVRCSLLWRRDIGSRKGSMLSGRKLESRGKRREISSFGCRLARPPSCAGGHLLRCALVRDVCPSVETRKGKVGCRKSS